jgi:endogenous inhibitor of DNA gyrase (YacG/DUF329 family)
MAVVPAPPGNRPKNEVAGQIDARQGRALCVYCRRQPVEPRWRPFCSNRCRLQDLSTWLDGGYRIAGEAISPEHSDVDDGS